MKTIASWICIVAGLAILAPNLGAQSYAPNAGAMNYAIVSAAVTAATPPFAGVGSTTNVAYTLGNWVSFDATGQASSGALGTYVYTQTAPNTGSLALVRTDLNPVFAVTQTLTFTGTNAGTFLETGTYGGVTGMVQGTFTITYLLPQSPAATNTGISLLEVYEMGGETSSTHRLVNIATRGFAGTGASVLDGGFVINGSTAETVVIRGGGPFLSLPPINLSGALAKPSITLYDSLGNAVATNTGWSNAVVLGNSSVLSASGVRIRQSTAADFVACGAYPWSAGSADSALTATLQPGAYTVVVSGL